MSNTQAFGCANGRESPSLQSSHRLLILQEFRINLGSRWSKEGGFVAGDEMTHDEVMDED